MASYLVQFIDATTDVVIEKLLLPADVADQAATAHAQYLAQLNHHPVVAHCLNQSTQTAGTWTGALCAYSIAA